MASFVFSAGPANPVRGLISIEGYRYFVLKGTIWALNTYMASAISTQKR